MKMLMGMNLDVPYKGKVFHVQTEDSGGENPVIITHIFLAGGIVATQRHRYDDIVSAEPTAFKERARAMMNAQHRSMVKALQSGDLDRELLRSSTTLSLPSGRSSIPLATPKKERPSKSASTETSSRSLDSIEIPLPSHSMPTIRNSTAEHKSPAPLSSSQSDPSSTEGRWATLTSFKDPYPLEALQTFLGRPEQKVSQRQLAAQSAIKSDS
jgi:hypothetical protein